MADGNCVIYSGYIRKDGYGQKKINGRTMLAHRIAWSQENGRIQDGLLVLHSCDNPSCVNIKHLRLGTNLDNARDMIDRVRSYQQRKTHCHKGHEFNEKNTRLSNDGKRNCRLCNAERHRNLTVIDRMKRQEFAK